MITHAFCPTWKVHRTSRFPSPAHHFSWMPVECLKSLSRRVGWLHTRKEPRSPHEAKVPVTSRKNNIKITWWHHFEAASGSYHHNRKTYIQSWFKIHLWKLWIPPGQKSCCWCQARCKKGNKERFKTKSKRKSITKSKPYLLRKSRNHHLGCRKPILFNNLINDTY